MSEGTVHAAGVGRATRYFNAHAPGAQRSGGSPGTCQPDAGGEIPAERRALTSHPWSEHVATVSAFLTVGFSPARYPGGRRTHGQKITDRGYGLVTRNVKDFAGLGVVLLNPWDEV